MKKALGLIILLGLAASPALAQKVNIDYAHDFDFKAVRDLPVRQHRGIQRRTTR